MQSLIAYKNPSNTSETLHRPRSEAEQTLALIAALSGITEREARSLDMEDVAEIMDFISPFLTSQGKQAKKK
jgi:hypothetical protein